MVLPIADNRHAGHHWAWEVAEVLHRDISIENIMFYKTKSEIIGVLNDWDHAEKKSNLPLVQFNLLNAIEVARKHKRINGEGAPNDSDVHSDPPHAPTEPTDEVASRSESELASLKQARYRTGTGPFMAIELLRSGPIYPFHRYRFDLESFCYVLVWFCIGFKPKKHIVAHIDTWKHGDFKQIALAKLRYVQDPLEQQDLWKRAKSKQYLDLYTTWAEPLIDMVCTVQDRVRDIERVVVKACRMSPEEVSEKLEGWKTEIMGYELAREQALTYEQVMAILVK
ncbi:hypothetical protein OBBRIDRAFT_32303 [Obba rivulosa]|uniref:Protein kinase domain-containing protein n=1 Tax=Obba rivulosa TaxID=1052685 RepID=A0A8E2DIG4_9APHY|nr:hypothetical protein OBBRIDRAFT_32303 [Obba rivulosa]